MPLHKSHTWLGSTTKKKMTNSKTSTAAISTVWMRSTVRYTTGPKLSANPTNNRLAIE